MLYLVGCNSNKVVSDISDGLETEMQEGQSTEDVETVPTITTEIDEPTVDESAVDAPATVVPVPTSVDIDNLEDCTLAVSLEKDGFYRDETDTFVMDVTVYTYDLYDMIDIATLKEGDTIVLGQNEVVVASIEHDANSCVLINGGLDSGGFELQTEDDTVYYERGYSDVKSYYDIGQVSLNVSSNFVFNDTSDLENGAVTMNAEEFVSAASDMDYYFNANNTTIQIEDGVVVSMTRVYAP
jgi:hypothetical protein